MTKKNFANDYSLNRGSIYISTGMKMARRDTNISRSMDSNVV